MENETLKTGKFANKKQKNVGDNVVVLVLTAVLTLLLFYTNCHNVKGHEIARRNLDFRLVNLNVLSLNLRIRTNVVNWSVANIMATNNYVYCDKHSQFDGGIKNNSIERKMDYEN